MSTEAVSPVFDFTVTRYGPGESVPTADETQAAASTQHAFFTEELAQPVAQVQPSAKAAPSDVVILALPHGEPARKGDFLLTHASGINNWIIRMAQLIAYRGRNRIFAHWSHAAILSDDHGNLIEAIRSGVQERNVREYEGTEYVVVLFVGGVSDSDREHAVLFATDCLKEDYNFLTIFSIFFRLFTIAKFTIAAKGEQICSSLVARSLERYGIVFKEDEPWQMLPADLAKHFQVRKIGQPGKVPDKNAGVVDYSRPGKRHKYPPTPPVSGPGTSPNPEASSPHP